MVSPYAAKPDHAFWRRVVSNKGATEVDPVTTPPFRIGPTDKIATAGSCFAQHITRALSERGISCLVTEQSAPADACDGVFSARFGNIYTVRQLQQLFARAYGLFEPSETAWPSADGRWFDPFRPAVPPGGFASVAALEADREKHLLAVQEMFERCNVFIFTLGLTEGWVSTEDGAVFPVCPGAVVEGLGPSRYAFHNFTVGEMDEDLRWFVTHLRRINPDVRILLTVSPVALVATYEDRHVLVANTYSKSALRVVAEMAATTLLDVAYFPSYEMITGAHTRSAFLAEDLRSVTDNGVAHVMSVFCKHYLCDSGGSETPRSSRPASGWAEAAAAMRARQLVICDEEWLDVTP